MKMSEISLWEKKDFLYERDIVGVSRKVKRIRVVRVTVYKMSF